MDQATTRAERLTLGDPLRGLAALAVVVFHVTISAAFIGAGSAAIFGEEVFGAAHTTLFSLSAAVHVFFVLSGYLLMRPFARWLVGGAQRPQLVRYGLHRLMRIGPAFWLAVLATAVLVGSKGAPDREFLDLALLVHGWDSQSEIGQAMPQAWTLDIEALFYLLLPIGALLAAGLLGAARGQLVRAGVLLAGIAALCLGTLAWSSAANTVAESQVPPKFLFAFTPGMALAVLEPLLAPRARGAAWARHAQLPLLVGSLLAFVLLVRTDAASFGTRDALATLSSAALMSAVVLRQWHGTRAWRTLDQPVLHALGRWSYGVYLAHTIVLDVTEPVFRDVGGVWPTLLVGCAVVIPLSVLVAAASWRFVERPALALADHLAARWRTRRAGAADRAETVAASAGVP
ncbi:acyltransferase [Conexibacter sp. SYSU D00693]|uniref:acyltransferase family protein n=1 Tax=Conexibacter sp. SYSU D00693 TaxID=2812560 RepID=UPI00196A8502|nr:acyltransferase [Conexibacter sp. SYSU D00693]